MPHVVESYSRARAADAEAVADVANVAELLQTRRLLRS